MENHPEFTSKWRLVLHKTTACFQKTTARFTQNNGLFSKKRRLTFHKTTCCFQKTTAHFIQNDVLFSKTHESRRKLSKKGKSTYPILRAEREGFEIVKILKSILLARTRTRAVQRVLSFCCHKCHSTTQKTIINKQINKKKNTKNKKKKHPMYKFLANEREKQTFYSFVFAFFRPAFSPISHQVWHLWQQKNKIAVERRALRAHERAVALPLFSHPTFLIEHWRNTTLRQYNRILRTIDIKIYNFEKFLSLFCDFFPLWGCISPYTY